MTLEAETEAHSALAQGRDWFYGPVELVNPEPEDRNDTVSIRYCWSINLHGEELVAWREYYDELNSTSKVVERYTCGVYQKLVTLPESLIPLYRAKFPDAPLLRDTWPWNTV